jgi:hypothetical protein
VGGGARGRAWGARRVGPEGPGRPGPQGAGEAGDCLACRLEEAQGLRVCCRTRQLWRRGKTMRGRPGVGLRWSVRTVSCLGMVQEPRTPAHPSQLAA